MSYRIIIDRTICSGYGSCIEQSPSLFALGADGIATAPAQTESRDAAIGAARACPMGAIAVLDEDGKELR
ncbi:MAG TPA: ferredoxin [Gaiellales bacterium]|nr:ferredoxin [Gaiellales bacterium]